jgi:hypothetical protein
MEHWFYVRTTGKTVSYDDGMVETIWPLASVMSDMSLLSRVHPPTEVTPEIPLFLVCQYSRGRDLVEEMVAANFWQLERRNDSIRIEMIHVPIFGPAEGLPFPRFDHELPADQDRGTYVSEIEEATHVIAGKISDKEYLAQKSSVGMMSRLNQVFEELWIHHEEYVVPPEVILSIEEKKKVAAKNATAVAKSKKRKG